MTADPRARWAEQLAVPVDAPADEVAAAFLRTLPDDLVPAVEQVLAARGLTGTDLPTGLDRAPEEALGPELEAFAARFWSLEPAERLLKWDELSRRGANPVRLRELEPGLDVTAPAFGDPIAEELAAQFRLLFVLPPRVRAIRRAQWLLARADGAARWRAALVAVQRDAPTLVALEPRLRTALDSAFDPAALAAGPSRMSTTIDVADFTHRVQAATLPASRPEDAYGDEYEDERAYEAADRARARNVLFGSPVAFILLFGCCTLSTVVRQLGRDSGAGSRSYTPAPVRDNSTSGYVPSGTFPEPAPIFSTAEVADFRRYEVEVNAGRFAQVPPRYDHWLSNKRPEPRDPLAAQMSQVDMFTPEEVAACELYERERATGRGAVRPGVYSRWLNAQRPGATPAREPGPGEARVFLDSYQILLCQRYNPNGRGPRPAQFDDWVRAGKPSAPGSYIVPQQPTLP